MMKFTATVLFVYDIERSKNFYTEVLGQEIEYDFGLNITFKSGISIWQLREDHVINKELKQDSGVNNLEMYFELEDIFAFRENLEQHDVNFFHDTHEEIWGQQTIRFFDPDGHLIEVGETLKTFVKRIYDKEQNIETVSQKTFIPIEKIKNILGIN